MGAIEVFITLTCLSWPSSLCGNRKDDLAMVNEVKALSQNTAPSIHLAGAHWQSCFASPSWGWSFALQLSPSQEAAADSGRCWGPASLDSTWRSEHAPCKVAWAFRSRHHHDGLNLVPTQEDPRERKCRDASFTILMRAGKQHPAMRERDMSLALTHPDGSEGLSFLARGPPSCTRPHERSGSPPLPPRTLTPRYPEHWRGLASRHEEILCEPSFYS